MQPGDIVRFLIPVLLAGCQTIQPPPNYPVHTYENSNGTQIHLMRSACIAPRVLVVIDRGLQSYAERFRAIESKWRMRDGNIQSIAGCWIELSEREAGAVSFFLLFEDGDYYLIEKTKFLARPDKPTT